LILLLSLTRKKESSKPWNGQTRDVGPDIVVFDSILDTRTRTNLSISEGFKKI
jgi:hypothetical protein